MGLRDLKRRVEKQFSMGRPPEYDRAAVELLLEAVDEIRAAHARIDELTRQVRLLRLGPGRRGE